jgi:hypothetical protein
MIREPVLDVVIPKIQCRRSAHGRKPLALKSEDRPST